MEIIKDYQLQQYDYELCSILIIEDRYYDLYILLLVPCPSEFYD